MFLFSKGLFLASSVGIAIIVNGAKASASLSDEYNSEKCAWFYRIVGEHIHTNTEICRSRSGMIYHHGTVSRDGSFRQYDKIGSIGKKWIDRRKSFANSRTILREFQVPSDRNLLVLYSCEGYASGSSCSGAVKKSTYRFIGTSEQLARQAAASYEKIMQERREAAERKKNARPWWEVLDGKLLDKPSVFQDRYVPRY